MPGDARPKKKTIRMIPQARTPAHEQDPHERACNFDEVNLGYLVEDAQLEAERCLMCPEQPCVAGCPVGIAIPDFIQRITARDYRGAYDVITSTNLLPAVCGRVCPQESQCEGSCTVGDTLEGLAPERKLSNDKAVIAFKALMYEIDNVKAQHKGS